MASQILSSSPVAFIIGAGGLIGNAVKLKLKEQGYAVALGSRTPDIEVARRDGFLPIRVNAVDPQSVQNAFEEVTAALGPPSVVIHIVASLTTPSIEKDPLSLPVDAFLRDVATGAGTFAIAQKALEGFRSEKLRASNAARAFIVTGNALPYFPPILPKFVGLAVQKEIEASLVALFAKSYKNEGIRGGIPPYSDFQASGPAHAKAFLDLINKGEAGDWDYRFEPSGDRIPQEKYTLNLSNPREFIDEGFTSSLLD
ncbi:hypothetical protein HWV62_38298 [Athelia sp. TMB]|nr:hypothetical protein HWV62_38298 [Athelia sp. TMB]